MRSTLRICYKFLPLFLGVVSLLLLASALAPRGVGFKADITIIFFLLSLVFHIPDLTIFSLFFASSLILILLIVYDLRKILYNRKNNLNLPPTPGLTSSFILLFTLLLRQTDIPAQLWFYTSSDRFEQVLVQRQILNEGSYKDITKIGNFQITDTFVSNENNPSKDGRSKSIYFVTDGHEFHGRDHLFPRSNCDGFAYLPNDRSAVPMEKITHIYGKWYIFHQVEAEYDGRGG